MKNNITIWQKIYKNILFLLAFYFFIMGAFLALFPNLLLTGLNQNANSAILGIIRGAGGATIPYALLYIFLAIKPEESKGVKYSILLANVLAIILDLSSIFFSEFTPMQAMIDLPVEVISLTIIIVFHNKLNINVK